MAARLGIISQKGLSEVIREEIKVPIRRLNLYKIFYGKLLFVMIWN
jgi:Mn2+/Fe2+ NRAMP family transporter